MSVTAAHALFEHLWKDYSEITSQAKKIHALLEEQDERFRNDHVALRTFNTKALGIEVLQEYFLELGYRPTGTYHFKEKKLDAKSYSHASGELPRVFISELILESCSQQLNEQVSQILQQLPPRMSSKQLLSDQSLWPKINFSAFSSLLEESEYAAWVAAFGIRANHFTVNVDDLKNFPTLQSLNEFLLAQGFKLNSPSSPIQGSPAELLEQSSTRADEIMWTFAGGEQKKIRSCYYEFCKRYTDPSTGKKFDGFITESADKIFESTNMLML